MKRFYQPPEKNPTIDARSDNFDVDRYLRFVDKK